VKEKPPPLLSDAEPTIAFQRSPQPAVKSKVDSLLPPGAEEAATAPVLHPSVNSPPSFKLPPHASAFSEINIAPAVAGATTQEKSLERAERKFWKNAILFGLSIAALLALFYWMAR
jgi:hypothetical protein